uniref:hypothetical protein n=1 Tax=Veillonella sp. CHU110 TaxID=2490947 RepID=UPI0019822127
MSILLQKKNVGDYSYMSSPNIYYRAFFYLEYVFKSIIYWDISIGYSFLAYLYIQLLVMKADVVDYIYVVLYIKTTEAS